MVRSHDAPLIDLASYARAADTPQRQGRPGFGAALRHTYAMFLGPRLGKPARHQRRRSLTFLGLATALSLSLAACRDDDGASAVPQSTGASETSDGPADVSSTGGAVQLNGEWPLTGETLEGDLPPRPVYAVKIDNTSGSAPQVGLSSADMVVEELVEGGLTRLAVFYYTELPDTVGPVRSMRASDIGILKPVDAMMIASGGAERTIRRLAGADIPMLTEGAPGFFRDELRLAPYNLFMTLSEAVASAGAEWTPPRDSYLPFGDEIDFSGTIPLRTIEATFSDSYTTSWEYSNGAWTRPESLAQPGDDFVADNVLLLRVKVGDAGYLDPGGYAVPETFFYGTGQAVLVHGDRALKCVWTKKDEGTPLTLATEQGDDVTVPAGRTWIELVPTSGGRVTLEK